MTRREVLSLKEAQNVYRDWRLRYRIEDGYRFEQEAELNVEQVMVHSLERMQRTFVAVLWAMHSITYILASWPKEVLVWLQWLGGQIPQPGAVAASTACSEGRLWLVFSRLRLIRCHPPPSFG